MAALGAAWLLVLVLLPPAAAAQEEAGVPSTCLSCEAHETVPPLAPGTVDARRAIVGPLEGLRADPPVPLVAPAPQEASPPGCGSIALVAGALTAAAAVLLAAVVEASFPWKDETSATPRYLMMGGIGFGVGAGYALVRCNVERSSSS